MQYRHEYKYLCDAMELSVLKMRACGILHPDPHAGPDGAYTIRSLYFDTPSDECFHENEGGYDLRDKYRIRIYNADAGRITLEKKSKVHGMTAKTSERIDPKTCRMLMEGRGIHISPDMPPGLKRLLLEMQGKGMEPKVIVEYVRYPFIEHNGNVRITFDTKLSSSAKTDAFLDPLIPARPVMEKGTDLMEVKWDAFLPGYIKDVMQLESLRLSGFSKYYYCRYFNTQGIPVL